MLSTLSGKVDFKRAGRGSRAYLASMPEKPFLRLFYRNVHTLAWREGGSLRTQAIPRLSRIIRAWTATGMGAFLLAVAGASPVSAQDKVYLEGGQVRVLPPSIPSSARNPAWPEEWEAGFWARANAAIQAKKGLSCNATVLEQEKHAYPNAFFRFLAGEREAALKCLEGPDWEAKTDHAHTLGIDYYWTFTIKGQMRKFFWFGEHGGYLSPGYRKLMLDAGKIWTEKDPATRPHPLYGTGNGEYGYGPLQKGYWVDKRGTDNMRIMRETSIYLMAEAADNEETRLLYRGKILQQVATLYRIGMSEWDSENYLSHGLAPFLTLYDFARDPEVKLLAKAALDWIFAASSLKYYRGAYGGPSARDYGGGNRVFGSLASHFFALYFGQIPFNDPKPEGDDVYAILSGYRPPPAIVEVARKNFQRPVEMLNTKPYYENGEPGKDQSPEFWETLFFGRGYYMGSIISADDGSPWDIGRFKLVAENGVRGVDFFDVATGDLSGRWNTKKPGDQIGQFRNLLLWLKPAIHPFHFQLPARAERSFEGGILFVKMERTWLALRPLAAGEPKPAVTPLSDRYPGDVFLKSEPAAGAALCGFALEVGEAPDHADFAAFKQAVKTKGSLDSGALAQGPVLFKGSDGATLKVAFNPANDIPAVERNGEPWDRAKQMNVYGPAAGESPVTEGWKQGMLTVSAGGRYFSQQVSPDGKVSFAFERGALGTGLSGKPEARLLTAFPNAQGWRISTGVKATGRLHLHGLQGRSRSYVLTDGEIRWENRVPPGLYFGILETAGRPSQPVKVLLAR